MKLVIGGYSQGKLDYVLKEKTPHDFYVIDREIPTKAQLTEARESGKIIVINHFHEWMRIQMMEGESPEWKIMEFVSDNSNCIVISDEIGNGIVPMEHFEREYRERTGRMLVKLAEQADEVVRIICGIGQRIK